MIGKNDYIKKKLSLLFKCVVAKMSQLSLDFIRKRNNCHIMKQTNVTRCIVLMMRMSTTMLLIQELIMSSVRSNHKIENQKYSTNHTYVAITKSESKTIVTQITHVVRQLCLCTVFCVFSFVLSVSMFGVLSLCFVFCVCVLCFVF